MAKAADAFRTISEVADELEIPKHVLRFWEIKFPQIRPMKRGGGRRYYRPEDVELLRGIRELLHSDGYTIKGVQKILREQGADHVKASGRPPEDAVASAPVPEQQPPARKSLSTRRKARIVKLPAASVMLIERALRELEECRTALLAALPSAVASKARGNSR